MSMSMANKTTYGSGAEISVGAVVIFTGAGSDAAALRKLVEAFEGERLCVSQVELPHRTGKTAAIKKVRTAIADLASSCGAQGDRIAVVAERDAADAAILGARSEWRVKAFTLFSGRLSAEAKTLLSKWRDNPTLCVVDSSDKTALRDLTDVYFSSGHSDSDIKVLDDGGSGLASIKSDPSIAGFVAQWVGRGLASVGRAQEVTFLTEDGWKIFGNLLLPDLKDDDRNGKSPGVVLLHSGRSDRFVFADMERLLVRAGFAVLNIDWRGRGKSINLGRYFDLSKEVRAQGGNDAKAAIDYLANQPGVDAGRIGLVGIIHGAEYAVRGSIGDARVKALALLTGYIPINDRESSYLTSGDVHVLYVSCTGHKQVTEAMRKLYAATPDKLTRMVVYEGGAIGYQLFELDEKFEPMIVEWLKEGLRQ
ncbi:MAG: dienelactone hydrolase family protein [Acidobacteria bacterium]|nr:dienelactone hydrolase family protein [Acidobacteriota bacterium]